MREITERAYNEELILLKEKKKLTAVKLSELSGIVDGYQYPIKDGAGIIQSKIHNHSF